MAATVSSVGLTGISFPLRHAGLGPFISSAGNVYMFGRGSVSPGTANCYKAADPMSTASLAGAAKTMSSATTTAIEAMAAVQVGNVIHVATQISTGLVYYNSFTMDTDVWNITTSETVQSAAATTFAPVASATFVDIRVLSSGQPTFLYSGGVTAMSGTLNTIYYRRRTGTNTYGTATAVATGTNDYRASGLQLGASDRLHIVYYDSTNADLYQRHLTSAGVLGTAAAFETSAAAITNHQTSGVAYDDGATRRVRVAYRQSTTNDLRLAYFDSADNPTVTTEAISAGAIPRFNTTDGQSVWMLANDSTTVHALYADNATSDLQHDFSANNNSGWGVDVNELAGTINKLTANVYTRSGTKYLAMVLDDGGTVKYAEIALAGAPAASTSYLYDIRRQTMTPLLLR